VSEDPCIFEPATYGNSTSREEMDAAIKAIIIPHLRELGFKGSAPHFRRDRDGACDVLTFDFFKAGGNFCIEIGRIVSGGFISHGRQIEPKGYKTSYIKPSERHRLGSVLTANYGDHWFDFGDRDPADVAHWVLGELARPGLWNFISSLEPHQGHELGWVIGSG